MVLAAGRSRRFGGAAKLHALFRGRPLLAHSLATVAAARERGIVRHGWVVVAADDPAAAALAAEARLESVCNDDPEEGLSASLRLGLGAVTRSRGGDIGAALILLGDQPLVRVETLEALAGGWRSGRGLVVRPRYREEGGTPGHPVLLDRSLWHLADAARGDAGLGALLPEATLIEVPGANPDVDTPADLHTLKDEP